MTFRCHWKALMIVVALVTTVSARADDFDALRGKWRDMLTQGTNASPANPLYSAWINSVGSTAQSYWNSLNTSPSRTNLWSTYPNLATNSSDITGSYSRLRAMALGYSVRGSALEGNASLRTAILSGLSWMYTNYYNPAGVVYDNWFDFTIAAPLALNDTVVLLYSNLSPAQVSNYMAAVEHFTPDPDLTAANKAWKALVVAVRAVIVKDTNKLFVAHLALSDVFQNVTSGDGFYADGSFLFHNYFPYNGGYGVELLENMGLALQFLSGTPWQVSDPAQTNVFRWIYDSFQPFLFRGAMMQMVDGRYHTRRGDDHEYGHDLLGTTLRIAQFAPPADAAAFNAFVKAQIQSDTFRNFMDFERPPFNVWANAVLTNASVVPQTVAASHWQFPSMDRVVHRTANWAFGLAMSSSRIATYESTRGENLKGWFSGDGMTCLYNNELGYHADNFWPTVDPYRLPGTTVDTITRTNTSGEGTRSQNNQTGGASILGLYGVAAMHANAWNSTLSARKSWFLFDNEIVCLGNSVSSVDGRGAETIIENRKLGLYGNNAFLVDGAPKPTGPGWSETLAGPSWAHLAGTVSGGDIGYYFPQAQTIKVLRESRSGMMADLNSRYGSTNRATRHYLTMYFDHGTNPPGATYSYVLLPGMAPPAVEAYAANPDVTIVENTSRLTAVKENKLGITAVNFWRDSSNFISGVSSDHKASVIFRNDGSLLDFGISDPTQTINAGINIELSTAASLVLSVDAGISVLQLSPTIKLAVNVSNTLGTTLRARFAVPPSQTYTLPAVADAYVQNGDAIASNFGGASTLAVKSAGTNFTRESYLRFDLSSVPGTLLSATLRLVPITINEPITNALALVSNNSWTENAITWNNKPAYQNEYARWVLGAVGSPVLVSVTPLAGQASALDQKLSLAIFSTNAVLSTNGGFTAYASKESGASANRPQLSVVSIRLRPTVSLSSLSETAVDAPATVSLSADAQAADGVIAGVEFYNGASRVAQSFAPPYAVTVPNLPAGNHSFTAVATDNHSLTATSSPVTISVFAPEPAGRGTGLNADYFSDRNLTTLALTRTDTNVNFLWGSAAPAGGLPVDNFSARWTGKLQTRHAGLHLFHTVSDDGARLWVDGRLLIDNWTLHTQTEDTGGIVLLPDRYYDVVMEYFDATGTAIARLYWTQPGVAKEIIPPFQLYPADQGLRATYFRDTSLATPAFTRLDDTVNFYWGTNSPDPTLLPGAFSARWAGKVRANQAGICMFFTLSDDAVRLYVNGQLLINNWTAHSLTENSNTIVLAAGQFYDLTMEFFNASGPGTAVLLWKPPGELKQVIPAGNLTPHRNNNPPALAPVPNTSAVRNSLLTFAVSATDPDSWFQSLNYSLDAGAPTGAAIHPATGVFSWTPDNTHAFGLYNITARVMDNGSPAMSASHTIGILLLSNMASATVTLAPAGGAWRYLDMGMDPGTAWRGNTFNDASWKNGTAPFGYGLGDETTITGFGTNAANKFITTWFRRAFFVPDVSLVQSLAARLVRDDGAIVHLNNTEIWRDNMPAGPVSFTNLASSAILGAAQTQFLSKALSPSVLVTGTNIIAVEIHQDSPSTPDARFDFELTAAAVVPADAAASIARFGGNTVLTWPQTAGLLRLFSATNLAPPVSWWPVSASPVLNNGQWTVQIPVATNSSQFFRLQTQ